MSSIPTAKKIALNLAFGRICEYAGRAPSEGVEDILMDSIHDLVKNEPDEGIDFVKFLIIRELPVYLETKAVVSTMEMLEGVLALRRIIREEGTLCL